MQPSIHLETLDALKPLSAQVRRGLEMVRRLDDAGNETSKYIQKLETELLERARCTPTQAAGALAAPGSSSSPQGVTSSLHSSGSAPSSFLLGPGAPGTAPGGANLVQLGDTGVFHSVPLEVLQKARDMQYKSIALAEERVELVDELLVIVESYIERVDVDLRTVMDAYGVDVVLGDGGNEGAEEDDDQEQTRMSRRSRSSLRV